MKAGFSTDAAPQPGEATVRVPFTPPPLDELKRLFPQLEVLELVGRGGMGAVYRARQPGLDRWVALKILPPRSTQRAGFTERFTREARALARLNHPSIVAVHDFGEAGGMPYFVMEFVEGVTLRQLVQQHRLGPREALQIVPQICDALQYAHDEGVVHRDIKPENILIDRKGRVKIADFGIAKILGDDQVLQTLTQDQVLGTPHYMAPEQIEHPAAVDHRADIYSLGVVFYEMLTGELPLGKFAPPSRKVEVDVRLDEVVLRALEKEPEHRYQHASEVKTAVETIAAATGVMSVPAEQPHSQAPQPSGPSGRYQFGLLASLEAGERVLHFQKRVGATLWKSLPTYRLNVSWPPLSEMELYVTDQRVIVVSHVLRLVTNEFSIWFPSAAPGAPRERFRRVTVGQSRWFGCYLDLISEHPEKTWYRSRELRSRLYLGQPELLERLILSAALGAQNPSHGSREAVNKVQSTVAVLPRWIRWTRWTARILSTLILLIVTSFFVAEGLPPFITQPGGVQLTSLGGALVLLGLLVGWWREGTAAVLTAGGWTLIRVSENSFRITTPLEIVLVVALHFAIVWWASQGRRTFVAVAVAGILALALITGRLLLPTNVHLEGTVTDAISGRPLPQAELTVANALSSSPARRVFPNARAAGDGHYSLYVGWYSEQKPLQVSTPGYETLGHVWAVYLGQKQEPDPILTQDWKLCEGVVAIPANVSKIGMAFQIYGPGSVWFDDLQIAWIVS
jgi:serine/threonine protein kinase